MSAETLLGRSRLNEAEALTNLLEAIKVCESSARQLAYMRQQPQWMQVQFMFENVRAVVIKIAEGGISRATNIPDLRRAIQAGQKSN